IQILNLRREGLVAGRRRLVMTNGLLIWLKNGWFTARKKAHTHSGSRKVAAGNRAIGFVPVTKRFTFVTF
ncbi:MAG TPA: hypothetical protein PK198_27295, partial [Saprospiraceae bacterium]|nr:hypothetical protein [Saprospiraceae bacterium]